MHRLGQVHVVRWLARSATQMRSPNPPNDERGHLSAATPSIQVALVTHLRWLAEACVLLPSEWRYPL